MGGGASKSRKTKNDITGIRKHETNVGTNNTVDTSTDHLDTESNTMPREVNREDSEAMILEAQKALQHIDYLSTEHLKSIEATETQVTWETQLDADLRNQTEEGRACIIIQKFTRIKSAEKVLMQKATWRNRNQLELFFERHATKYTKFYEKIYSNRIEQHNLCMNDNVDMSIKYHAFPKLGENKDNNDYSTKNISNVLNLFHNTNNSNHDHNYLQLDDFLLIVDDYSKIVQQRETLLKLPKKGASIPLYVIVGDLHGHFEDLVEILNDNGPPTKTKPYIFTGNIINYGPKSIYCITLIMLWTLAEPDSVYFLRGNHEHASYSLKFGFVHEICSVYTPSNENQAILHQLFVSLHELFQHLPLCIKLYETCLICHSGVWRDERVDIDSLKAINRANEVNIGDQFREIGIDVDLMAMSEAGRNHCIVQDILWSDLYDSASATIGTSPIVSFNEARGISILYDKQHVKNVLENNKLDTLIISGAPLENGYEGNTPHIKRVFSASSYFGNNSNLGGYLLIEQTGLQIHPCSFSVEGGKRDKHYHYLRGLSNSVREHLLDLENSFHKLDYKKTGMVTILQWAHVMEAETGLHVPWLMDRSDILDWDEMDLETNKVNYHQFLYNKGLTEKNIKNRRVQAYILKFSRPLYIYFDCTKEYEEIITKAEFLTSCNLLVELSKIDELKENGIAEMMYDALSSPMYSRLTKIKKGNKKARVSLQLLKLLANGKYFMSKEEVDYERRTAGGVGRSAPKVNATLEPLSALTHKL
jgi:hypothetical protein